MARLIFLASLFAAAIFTLAAAEQLPKTTDADFVAAELAPLPLRLPVPSMANNGPAQFFQGPHIEHISDRPRLAFLAPRGVTNVALGKGVTSSTTNLWSGRLSQITDGQKEPIEDQVVELSKGVQWVQIDLKAEHQIYAILLWHNHITMRLFRGVIVQTADDPEFRTNVRTLFNNDWASSCGLGAGTEKEYYETHEGKLIDTKGIKARYLRFYSNGYRDIKVGDEYLKTNDYQEIEVYGLPAK